MSRHRVDGVIVAPASRDHQYLQQEQVAGVPFVFIDRPPYSHDADVVIADSRDRSTDAVKHLMKYGHRRIAFVGDLPTTFPADERFLGYGDALHNTGLSVDPALIARDLRIIETAYTVAG